MMQEPSTHTTMTFRVPWGLPEILLALVGLSILIVVGGSLFASLQGEAAPSTSRVLAGVVVLDTSLIGIAWWLGPRKWRGPVSLLGFRGSTRPLFLWAVVALIISLSLTGCYLLIANIIAPDTLVPPPIPEEVNIEEARLASLSTLVFLGPLAEETFFRGFLFTGLANRWGLVGGAVASALLFALVHVTPEMLVPAFMTGIVLAWVYYRTGSLWASILAHMAQNGLAFASGTDWSA